MIKKKVNLISVEKIEYKGRDGTDQKQYKYVMMERGGDKLIEVYNNQSDGELFIAESRTSDYENWDESSAFEVPFTVRVFDGKVKYSLDHGALGAKKENKS